MANEPPKKDWKALERHYKLLSEVWSHEYDDQVQVSKAIMIMHGCLVEMHSEVIKFEIKHGTERSTPAYNRLKILEDQLAIISKVQDDYYRIKYNHKRLLNDNEKLKSIILEMEKSIQLKKENHD